MVRARILLMVAVLSAGVLAGCNSTAGTTGSTSAPTVVSSTSAATHRAAAAAHHKKHQRRHHKRHHAAATPTPTPTPTHHHRRHVSAPVVQQCTPLTNGGNCYEPGEFCRNSDHGVSGVAGNGERIRCEDNNGWRWEPI